MQLAVKFTTLDVIYMTRLSITRLARKQTANPGSYTRRVRGVNVAISNKFALTFATSQDALLS